LAAPPPPLAAKSTPPEVRDELLGAPEAGANITREEIKERIAASKKPQACGRRRGGGRSAGCACLGPRRAGSAERAHLGSASEPEPFYSARPSPIARAGEDAKRVRAELIDARLGWSALRWSAVKPSPRDLITRADPQEIVEGASV